MSTGGVGSDHPAGDRGVEHFRDGAASPGVTAGDIGIWSIGSSNLSFNKGGDKGSDKGSHSAYGSAMDYSVGGNNLAKDGLGVASAGWNEAGAFFTDMTGQGDNRVFVADDKHRDLGKANVGDGSGRNNKFNTEAAGMLAMLDSKPEGDLTAFSKSLAMNGIDMASSGGQGLNVSMGEMINRALQERARQTYPVG